MVQYRQRPHRTFRNQRRINTLAKGLFLRGWKRLGLRGRDILLIYLPIGIVTAVVAGFVFTSLGGKRGGSETELAGTAVVGPGDPLPSQAEVVRPPGPARLQPVSSAQEIAVAAVNDEVITLAELRQRSNLDQVLYTLATPERIDFQSENGREVFWQLQEESLSNLIGEKVVEQLARPSGITVQPGEVEDEIQRLLKTNNVTKEQLTAALEQQGVPYDDFVAMVEKVTTLNKFVENVVLQGVDDDERNMAAKAWFDDIYDEANIKIYYNSGAQQDDSLLQKAESAARAYTASRPNGPVTVKARDLGSHVQVDVFKDGRLIQELVYMGGEDVKEIVWG